MRAHCYSTVGARRTFRFLYTRRLLMIGPAYANPANILASRQLATLLTSRP
jgi:hypothetical protein